VVFTRVMPKELVSAFRATLEELSDASILLHVVDASDPARDEQAQAVERILEELELAAKPRLTVWNKVDVLSEEELEMLLRRGGVAVSAATGRGLKELLDSADRTLFAEGSSSSLGTV